ncbi:MAG: hypothetical protein ACRD51_17365 [Candidatus Acidiferrum sp.]
MFRRGLTGFVLLAFGAFVCAAQSPSGTSQASQSQPAAHSPASTSAAKTTDAKAQPADKNAAGNKKKPKKVWTEDDLSKVSGGISVVGDAASPNGSNMKTRAEGASYGNTSQESQVSYYRDQLRQLQAQLDVTDKKIDDLRNFKGENTSASGGINPNHGYTMTPVADQIKQLEDKRKQIQDKIDAVTDEARKKGIEPGQLR